MKRAYFKSCNTCEELKREYHKLARVLHPDCGGDQKSFVDMQAEFDEAFKRLKNIHTSASGETYEKETTETAGGFMSIINALLSIGGLDVELCGSWVWVGGETYKNAEKLKGLGLKWSKGKKKWYYNPDPSTKKRRGVYSMEKIRQVYDSERFTVKRARLEER